MAIPLARFGIALTGLQVRRNVDVARYAEEAGADSIWVNEGRLAAEAIVPMAVYASATQRVRVGSAVIPLWTRNPALIAQTFATLDGLAPERIVLGLGAWWEPIAARTGVDRTKPARAMREVVEAVRALQSLRDHVTYRGAYVHRDDVYLDHGETAPHRVKVHIGAVGTQMLRLAGRIADGVILNNNNTVRQVRVAVEQVRKGAASVGRTPGEIELAKPINLRVTDRKRDALQEEKLRVAMYLAQQPHIEGPMEVDPDLTQRVKALIPWPATTAQAREGARLIPDDVVEKLVCSGDEDEVWMRLGEYLDAGVTLPVLNAPTKNTIDFLARRLERV